jgi:hypothetical protein
VLPTVAQSLSDLEARYGVTSKQVREYFGVHPCDSVPHHELYRWMALLDVQDKENDD